MPFKKGNPGCPCCKCKSDPTICVTAISSCPGNPAISGATVTLKKGSTTVATCTTSRQIQTLAILNAGSGYTDGTDFALGISGGGGSGASALFDVVGGMVTNLRLTDGGHDFDGSAITFDFSASAGGSGATAGPTLKVQCCFRGLSNGSYVVTIDADGYPTYTSPTLKIPPCSISLSPLMTPNKALVLIWVGACGVVEGSASPQMTGVTVEAKQGGVTVASGVTDSTGHITLRVPLGFTTSFTATETATGRYDPRTVTGGPYSTICPSTTPITDVQILLPAASGYVCYPGCLVPVSTGPMSLSTPNDGGFTLAWDPTRLSWWASNGTITYEFDRAGQLWRYAGPSVGALPYCVIQRGGGSVPVPNWTSSISCPPAFAVSFVGNGVGPYRGTGNSGSCFFDGFISPGGGTITITS